MQGLSPHGAQKSVKDLNTWLPSTSNSTPSHSVRALSAQTVPFGRVDEHYYGQGSRPQNGTGFTLPCNSINTYIDRWLNEPVIIPVPLFGSNVPYGVPMFGHIVQQNVVCLKEGVVRVMFRGYVTAEERRKSFEKAPRNLDHLVHKLVHAGFFLQDQSGATDLCVCFMCGNQLSNWNTHDDPMKQHMRHFPRCQYLSMIT